MPSAQGDKPVGARNGHRGPTHQTIAARACSGRKDMSNSPSPHPISKAIPGCQIRALSGTGSCGKPRGLTRCHGCPSQSPMILAIRHRRGLDARAIYSSHDKTRKNENERQVRMAMILGVKKERMRTRGGAGNPVLDGVCLSILPRVVVCCLHSMNWTAVCAERQQTQGEKTTTPCLERNVVESGLAMLGSACRSGSGVYCKGGRSQRGPVPQVAGCLAAEIDIASWRDGPTQTSKLSYNQS